MTDRLPDTLEWVLKFGHTNKEMKDLVYAKLVDEDYVKYLYKLLKKDEKIKNIKYLPIIIKEIIQRADQENNERLASDPNAKLYNMTDLAELSVLILKKKLKKGSYKIKVKVMVTGNETYKASGWKTVTFKIKVK